MFDENGIAKEYDDTFDITIHCESEKEQNEVLEILNKKKIGHWIDADGNNAICSYCNRLNHLYGDYCKHCGTRNGE